MTKWQPYHKLIVYSEADSFLNKLGDIFLKNLFLKCFWWALRNNESDFLIFKEGGKRCFLRYRSENGFIYKTIHCIIKQTY